MAGQTQGQCAATTDEDCWALKICVAGGARRAKIDEVRWSPDCRTASGSNEFITVLSAVPAGFQQRGHGGGRANENGRDQSRAGLGQAAMGCRSHAHPATYG